MKEKKYYYIYVICMLFVIALLLLVFGTDIKNTLDGMNSINEESWNSLIETLSTF